jgi:flagellar biosynthesis/type III secretory pathway chaperone
MTLEQKIHHTKQIANAIQNREDYYTLETEVDKIRHIELPTPQVAGTMMQQRTYAMGKAMELIESYENESLSS